MQIYNFSAKINVDSTAESGINLQSTFLDPPPRIMLFLNVTQRIETLFIRASQIAITDQHEIFHPLIKKMKCIEFKTDLI